MGMKLLPPAEPAPWFQCRTTANAQFSFDTVAGRHVVMFFFGSAAAPPVARLLEIIAARRDCFDDTHLCYFGVSADPDDERLARAADSIPGMRIFWDFDRTVSTRYGVVDADGRYSPTLYILDPRLRVLKRIRVEADAEACAHSLFETIGGLERFAAEAPALPQAPVLVVPRIFEPQLCADLIGYYDSQGSRDSGFMREVNGKTVEVQDYGHKRRRDCIIEDQALLTACMARIHDRLAPEIHRAFQFQATRIERHIVACYDASERGHFRPHRDNTTRGTAHRRFAVSLFLNTGDYAGGQLRFPEYGRSLYFAPAGGAVVFSCSMLHEAMPVTRGRRMMYLPFLYDEAARRVREQNFRFLDESLAPRMPVAE